MGFCVLSWVVKPQYVVMLSQIKHLFLDWLSYQSQPLHAVLHHSILHATQVLNLICPVDNVILVIDGLPVIFLMEISSGHAIFLVRGLESLLGRDLTELEMRSSQFSFGLQSLQLSFFINGLGIEVQLLRRLTKKLVSVAYQNVRLATRMYDWRFTKLEVLNLPVGLKVVNLVLLSIIS